MRLQSSLGRVYENDRPDMNMSGYLTVAKILKVHHKSNTADVVVVSTRDTFISSEENEGRFAARILQGSAGFNEKRGKAWGSTTPYAEGSLVLLGFLDNMKSRPTILGAYHSPDKVQNVLPGVYPLNQNQAGFQRREALKTLTVYPSQGYKKIDGEGNIEFAHPSKSFFAMYNKEMDNQDYLTDNHNGFDHENLSEVDASTGKVYETDIEEAQTSPSMLFVHRSNFNKEKTTWTKFFLHRNGMFRWTRDNNDEQLTFVEVDEKGRFGVRRQVDSPYHQESEDFGEVAVETDGTAMIRRVQGDSVAEVGVNNFGQVEMGHGSGSRMIMDEDLELEVEGDIISDSLSRFIERNHIVVSPTEPENPLPFLVWIDTSQD